MSKVWILYDGVTIEEAMAAARGCYQRGLLLGEEAWSGSTLTGRAANYGFHYACSRVGLINRLKRLSIIVEIRREGRRNVAHLRRPTLSIWRSWQRTAPSPDKKRPLQRKPLDLFYTASHRGFVANRHGVPRGPAAMPTHDFNVTPTMQQALGLAKARPDHTIPWGRTFLTGRSLPPNTISNQTAAALVKRGYGTLTKTGKDCGTFTMNASGLAIYDTLTAARKQADATAST